MHKKLPILGKTLGEAAPIIEEADCTFRVVSRDGTRYVVTMDHRIDRLNLRLVDGKITDYTVG